MINQLIYLHTGFVEELEATCSGLVRPPHVRRVVREQRLGRGGSRRTEAKKGRSQGGAGTGARKGRIQANISRKVLLKHARKQFSFMQIRRSKTKNSAWEHGYSVSAGLNYVLPPKCC
jgi:hypothetical protein